MQEGPPQVRLLAARARVTSKACKDSTPRSELNGLVLLSRVTSAVLEGMVDMPHTITLVGDSTCTIAATCCIDNTLAAYFSNRVMEVQDDHIEKWKDNLKIRVDPIQFIPGDQNPADIGTRGKARAEQLSQLDVWQTGPKWLIKE